MNIWFTLPNDSLNFFDEFSIWRASFVLCKSSTQSNPQRNATATNHLVNNFLNIHKICADNFGPKFN